MSLLVHAIKGFSVNGIDFLGAVSGPTGQLAWPRSGQSVSTLRDALGDKLLALYGTRNALRCELAFDEIAAPPTEPQLFAGLNVLVAFRQGETSNAIADWFRYHQNEHGAEAALIFDRAAPNTLASLMPQEVPSVNIVVAHQPLGRSDGPDMRAANTAPAAPRRGTAPLNAWHAPLNERAVCDLLRHRFLGDVRAVAFVNPGDLLLPGSDGRSVFDVACENAGSIVQLKGVETYPWRLRQDQPAPHSDHVSKRRAERRTLLSWAISPADSAQRGVWRTGLPHGLPVSEVAPVPFIRAMGVVYSGAPINKLVRKADLKEDGALVELMSRSFGAEPLRLPAPAAIAPRPEKNSTTIVTAMKNEGPFVLDWIAHHRAIGVDRILVYTNDCADGTDHMLSLLSDAGVIHRDNPYRASGKVPQYAAFRAAEEEVATREADWLMTLDVDEYVNIHTGDGSISALLGTLAEAHVISIPWRMFGNADIAQFEDRPVTNQFTRCAPEFAPRPLQAWAFKTIYRNAGLFRRLGVHRPKGLVHGVRDSLHWVDATGKPLPSVIWDKAWRMSKAQWGYTHATINHYAVRSAESFLVKRERGKVNRTKREQGLAYWFRMNHNAEEDRSILRLGDLVAQEKRALLALPGVVEAHERTVSWHRERIAALKDDTEYADLYGQITSPRMQHLSRIATNFGANVHLVGPQVIPEDIAASDPDKLFYWTVKLSQDK